MKERPLRTSTIIAIATYAKVLTIGVMLGFSIILGLAISDVEISPLLWGSVLAGSIFVSFVTAPWTRQDVYSTDFGVTRRDESPPKWLAETIQRVKALEGIVLSGDVEKIVSTERAKILERISADISADQLAQELRKHFEADFAASVLRAKIREIFDDTIARLEGAISTLSERGRGHLRWGVLTTFAAVGLLGYMVLGATKGQDLTSVPDILGYYIPRVTTAIFIEVFAFFFLNLYRNSLDEIRYYQDEITKISRHRIALLEAEATGEKELIARAVEQLARADRQAVSASEGQVESKDLVALAQQVLKVAEKAKG